MIHLIKTVLPFCLFILGSVLTSQVQDDEIWHQVDVWHPGVSLTDPVEKTLVQIKGEPGSPDTFYMAVETVVCGDSQCKIDTIHVFWDELGRYQRVELPIGVELEKAAGQSFTMDDYQKLDAILANPASSLREVYKEEVVGTETSEGVDAISGATILLHTDDFVKGAVWTCYTLWHWVNGNVPALIRTITGDALQLDTLHTYVEQQDLDYKILALEELIKRHTYQHTTAALVLAQAKTDDKRVKGLVLDYIESGSAEFYFSSIEQLYPPAGSSQRLQYLSSLLEQDRPTSNSFFERLSQPVLGSGVYQEINLFLTLLEENDVTSSLVFERMILLLNQDDFLIARRVYWYLSGKDLSIQQQRTLAAFYTKYQDKL